MEKGPYTVILFYLFTDIADPRGFVDAHKAVCAKLGLKGRMIVAEEGVNATFEGLTADTDEYIRFLKSDPRFDNVAIKESAGDGNSFPKLSIKVRKEVVTLGAGRFDVARETARELPASELEKWYEKKDDFVVLDLRNDYEIASGKFEGTIDPGLANFRDLPGKLAGASAAPELAAIKNKKVVTVCTGGIRCEKATCLLKKAGFTDLYQLKDGIHTYMKEYPAGHFKGTLFVFDNRMTTDVVPDKIVVANGGRSVIGTCTFCQTATEDYYSDDRVRPSKKVLCCKDCLASTGSYLRETVNK